jgi:hypothetical protein
MNKSRIIDAIAADGNYKSCSKISFRVILGNVGNFEKVEEYL